MSPPRDMSRSRRKPRNRYDSGERSAPRASKGDVKYEIIRMVEVEYGDGGFYEVSKKVRRDGRNEVPFFSIARGFYGRRDGARIVMESMTISASGDTVVKMADALMQVSGEEPVDNQEYDDTEEDEYDDDY